MFPDVRNDSGNNLRESFNGRKAVSKTVNEGSIPSSRAIRETEYVQKNI